MNGNELLQMINDGSIKPYCFYNTDIDYCQAFSTQHYIENKHDSFDKNQSFNILFYDIEVFTNHGGKFPDPKEAAHPISAITIYDNYSNTYKAFMYLTNKNISKFPKNIDYAINYYKKELSTNNYTTDENLEVYIFDDELKMIEACWKSIHEIDPCVLSGWNSNQFDTPYIYYRLANLYSKNEQKINNTLSKFGCVQVNPYNDKLIRIPEYIFMDLLYLYKPRD